MLLQVQHPVLDLLGPALVPILGTDVAAGPAGHVHLGLVGVAAVGADPNELAILVVADLDLAVVAAALAVVRLGVQLRVHDVVVDELHQLQDRIDVLLHVGDLDVRNRAAGGKLLELRLKGQLGEGIDLLGDMDVVGIGDVALVRDAGDHAEAALQALGELVGGGLQRGAVEGEIDVVLLLPALAGIVHVLHDLQGEGLGLSIGVAAAGHVLDTLIKARVAEADGGIAAVEEPVDGLALFQAGQRAVLPQDGRGIGQGALEPLVAAHQTPVAQLQPLVEDLPELVEILAGAQGHIHQIDGDDTLVEAAVILMLAGLVVACVCDVAHAAVREPVGSQEGAAAHADVDIALEFQHLLLADEIGNHPLGGALGGQTGQVPVGGALPDVVLLQHVNELGEGGGDPDTLLVLDTLVALAECLLDNHGQVTLLLLVSRLVEVHEHGDEGGLSVGGHQGDHLVLDGLDTAADLFSQTILDHLGNGFLAGLNAEDLHFIFHGFADLFPADLDEGGQVGKADGLAAVLVGSYLCDDLGGDIAGGGEGMGLFNQGAGNDSAVLQHVFQIHQIAVVHMLGIVVGIVEMDNAELVGIDNFLGQQDTLGDILGNLTGHIVALDCIDGGILVGVLLLDLFVVAFDEAQNPVVGGVGLPGKGTDIAVSNVLLCNFKGTVGHNGLFHQILNFLHRGAAAHLLAGDLNTLGDPLDLQGSHSHGLFHGIVGLGDGHHDLVDVKDDFCAVSLDDLHRGFLLGIFSYRFSVCTSYYTRYCGFVKS